MDGNLDVPGKAEPYELTAYSTHIDRSGMGSTLHHILVPASPQTYGIGNNVTDRYMNRGPNSNLGGLACYWSDCSV